MISRSSSAAADLRRAPIKTLAARHVALDADNVLSPGCVEWDAAGRIVALRRARKSEPVRDLAVLPGLVNAHAHLQLEPLARVERRFLPWVSELIAARSERQSKDHRRIALNSLRELLRSGTTAVGEIDSTGDTGMALRRLPMAGRCFREVTGFHLKRRDARDLVRAVFPKETGCMRSGLSPHAPYSVSPDLMRAAAQRTRNLTIHCAELPEEQQFLRTGSGPFAELLERLGRLPEGFRAPGCGAVRWLEKLEVLQANTLLVHCQELERGDVGRIASSGASVVVCPGTIRYFQRTPPQIFKWLRAGVPVALGTDSHASNQGLSMRRELALAAEMWPELSPRQLLSMATSVGGRALGGPFGGLRRRRRADFLTVRASGAWEDTLAAFVHDQVPIERVVLAGQVHRICAER